MKIIATNITNLTDARYFAAWGVDYLAFAISSVQDFLRVKGIIEWVEGPLFLLEISPEIPPALQQEFIDEIEPAGLIKNPDRTISLFALDFESIAGRMYDHLPPITQEVHVPVLNAVNLSSSDLVDWIREDRGWLFLQGSEESKVGEKDYTRLDDVLDCIEQIREEFDKHS